MKHLLSTSALLAALAFTGTAAFAHDTQTNSLIPGSPGFTGATVPAGSDAFTRSPDGISKAEYAALYGDLNGANKVTQTNSAVPGSPGYTGAAMPAGAKGFPSSPNGITKAEHEALYGDLNDASKDTQTNSAIPGSPGFTGSTIPAR